MTYYAASYWYAGCEPSSVAVARVQGGYAEDYLVRDRVGATVKWAMQEDFWQAIHIPDRLPEPELCWSGVHAHPVRELFTAAELKAHRRALMNGEVVWLEKG